MNTALIQSSSILIGLGNPFLSDDAVGLRVARAIHDLLQHVPEAPERHVDLFETSVGGFELVEMLIGYDKAVLIDAIQTEHGTPGDHYLVDYASLSLEDIPCMTHQVGLLEGLTVARRLDMHVPIRLHIYAIEAADLYTFSESMTPAVAAAVPEITKNIMKAEYGLVCTCDS